MSIIDQAKYELKRINFGDEDSAVMIDLLERFFDQWDSGGAVHAVAPLLPRLIAGKPLSPLTGDDDEWVDMSEYSAGEQCWQNRRCSTVFKQMRDGRLVAYNIDVPGRPEITFPYWPEKAEVASPVIEIG